MNVNFDYPPSTTFFFQKESRFLYIFKLNPAVLQNQINSCLPVCGITINFVDTIIIQYFRMSQEILSMLQSRALT